MALAAGLQPEEPLGLPGEHLVGRPLEGLASMTNRRPGERQGGSSRASLAAPAAPLDGERDQVQVCRGFTLTQADPLRPASYAASSHLRITPSCPSTTARRRTIGRPRPTHHQPPNPRVLRDDRVSRSAAHWSETRSASRPRGAAGRRRPADPVAPVCVAVVDAVSSKGRRRRPRRGPAPRRRGSGRSRAMSGHGDDLRQPCRCRRGCGEHGDLLAVLVHLDPDTIELRVNREGAVHLGHAGPTSGASRRASAAPVDRPPG